MTVEENVPLAPLTTFHIGGPARYFINAASADDVAEAAIFARDKTLPLYPLGGGSNLLVPDEGVEGVVLRLSMNDIRMGSEGREKYLVAGAGASWDAVVDTAATEQLFGIENLAGIPGTLGGAIVQNIGAYGAELENTFLYAEAVDRATGEKKRITRDEAEFGYRTSIFKNHRSLIITHAALRFSPEAAPNLAYADLARQKEAGQSLDTPLEIARAVRAIRATKFPQGDDGTAGSFFKNPILSPGQARELLARYPGLPTFPQPSGEVKVSLAWLLDHALRLKGHAVGSVRLYEKQPLVIAAKRGASAKEVDALAREIAKRVHALIGIMPEREVETFGADVS